MNSKSRMLFSFIKEVDGILSKLHSSNPDGTAITPGDQAWMDTRDRLMKIKIGSKNNFTFPVNWTMSEQLIMDELISRPDPWNSHIELERAYHGD